MSLREEAGLGDSQQGPMIPHSLLESRMAEPGAGQRLKVFISYSRRDSSEFAEELVAGLELAGFAPSLDRHDISAGEPWEARLSRLIAEADTVVFIVSPEAVKSERCAWETSHAGALSKRLLPAIYKPVPDADIPEYLRRLQFVRFDTAQGLTRPLAQLAAALREDLDWVREHTRLGELAARWAARGRPEWLLLRGGDVEAAQGWLARRQTQAPEITALQQAFLDASIATDAAAQTHGRLIRRQSLRMHAAVGVLAVAAVLALAYGGWSYRTYLLARLGTVSDIVSPKVLTAEAVRDIKPMEGFRECAVCPEMVVIRSGQFMMGANDAAADEKPVHKVVIAKTFAVSRFEVSFDQWDACAALGGCDRRPGDQGWGRGSRPVINVSWRDAKEYVEWLSRRTGRPYRLLSEAEWEYLARSDNGSAFPWGDQVGSGNANCAECNDRTDAPRTTPVGSFAPNRFGLYDLHGNVWEWVEDCYTNSYEAAPTDGSARTDGACNVRVLRGGAFDESAQSLRASGRFRDAPDSTSGNVGFRVARTLSP